MLFCRALFVLFVAVQVAQAAAGQLPLGAPAAEPEAASPVSAWQTVPDATIRERIQGIFDKLERLRDVRVEVESGIVTLSGEVLSIDVRQEAESLARRVEGVITVENRVSIVRNVGERLKPTFERLEESLYGVIGFSPLLLVGLVILGVFWLVGALLGRWRWLYSRFTDNVFVQDLVSNILKVVVILIGAVLALQVLDAFTLVTALLGTAGVVGLVLGLAFRDIAENYIAGALLSLRQPFLPHDVVKIEGYEGKIIQLTSRSTLIMTWDGNHVRIPNATVIKSITRNYSRNPQRRFDFTMRICLDHDPAKAVELGVEALRGQAGVLKSPEPEGWTDEIGEWSIVVHYFGWIDQGETSWPKAKSEAIRRVKAALEHGGIVLARPMYDLRVKAEPLQPPAPPPAPEELEPVATAASLEQHLDRQIAEERAQSPDRDLLSTESQTRG